MNAVPGTDPTQRIRMAGASTARFPLPRAAAVNYWLFWALAAATLADLPRMTNLVVPDTFGTTRLVGAGYLLLAATARWSPVQALGMPGLLLLMAVASHLVIGTSVSVYHDPDLSFLRPALDAWDQRPLLWQQQYGVFGLLMVAAVAPAAHHIVSRIGIERLLRGVLVFLVVACIIVPFSPLFYIFGLTDVLQARNQGTFNGPNHAALMTNVTLVLALALLSWGKKRALAVAGICIAPIATVATGSRSGMILMVAVLLLYFLWDYKRHGMRAAIVFGVMTAGFAAAIVWNVALWEGTSLDLQRLRSFSLDSRTIFWAHAWSKIQEAPLLGSGIGTFREMADFHYFECRTPLPAICGVHNHYMLLLGEAGILPLTLWVLFLVAVFSKCSWVPDSLPKAVAMGWALCFALSGLADHNVFLDFVNFFVLGLVCGLLTCEDVAKRSQPLHLDKRLE